jgi:hypothetical protein
MKNFGRIFLLGIFAMFLGVSSISAAAVVRSAAGANAAAIQTTVDQFRTDLGALNPNTTQTFAGGRREINWDGVPDAFSAPNFFPSNFFNSNSPRGVIFGSPASNSGNDTSNFIVSASAASGTPVRFGNIDASYSSIFQTFSAERLFTVRSSNDNSTVLSIQFFIPGTNIPAGVSGFGAVFCDVDSNINAIMRVYGTDGRLVTVPISVTAANNGLSFLGISFNAGEKIARVEILSGNKPMVAGNIDGTNGVDVIALDDFIYGEPHAIQAHSSDFDGDGKTDRVQFRPSTGQWFVLQSGSNTLVGTTFGTTGDIPVEGDYDGDSKADFAIWRPSSGQWIVTKSSNTSQFIFVTLGATGDKPVPGDYDGDGLTDPAVWRPSSSGWFFLKSSTSYSSFDVIGFGIPGDVPPQGSAQ